MMDTPRTEGKDGHVIVIGFTHLGERIRSLTASGGKPVVVVEADAALVSALVREEEPVVVGSPRDPRVLAAARIERAKVVIVATDDLESAAVACKRVRERNEHCELVVRCADDDVGAVLAKTYRARALSTTRLAADFIKQRARKARVKSALVVGDNSLADRVTDALEAMEVSVLREPDVTDGASAAGKNLVVVCDDDLGQNLIRVDRIRDVNRTVDIVCRAFHDDAAELLTRAPFSCVVLSTSRHAAQALVRAGVFREIGAFEEVAQAGGSAAHRPSAGFET